MLADGTRSVPATFGQHDVYACDYSLTKGATNQLA